MKRFLLKLLLMAVIVLAAVETVNALYVRNTVNFGTMGACKNDSAYIDEVPVKIQICNFGNSQEYYGFDYSEYENRYACFNFALPSQSLSYDYRILQEYSDRIEDGATVFIGISYISFFGEKETLGADFTSQNKRYYKFLSKNNIKEYDLKTDIFINYFPALSVPLKDMAATIMGKKENTDCWQDTTDEAKALEHATARYNSHILSRTDETGNRIVNEEEIEALYSMIDLCRELNARPVLVTTPYLKEYTDTINAKDPKFYKDFYDIMDRVTREKSVVYEDFGLSENYSDGYTLFFNTDHMNRSGAAMWTGELLEQYGY